MNRTTRLRKVAMVCYTVAAVAFIVFLAFVMFGEKISVYEARPDHSYDVIDPADRQEVEDPGAPCGMHTEFLWTLPQVEPGDTCLAFYTVHHNVEVYLDGELVYSLAPDAKNRLTRSPSSNWVTVTLYPRDSGKNVRVVATPVYEAVRDRAFSFYVGSHSAILLDLFKADLPQLVLAFFCILLGLCIIIVSLVMLLQKNYSMMETLYLGNFAVLLGIWRITDTRFSPILFSHSTLALGYITIAMLFIGCAPLLLAVSYRFSEQKRTPMLYTSIFVSVTALAVLILQISGFAELREILTLSHVLIVLSAAVLLITAVTQGAQNKIRRNRRSTVFFALLFAVCAVSDIIFFYRKNSSSGIMYMIVAIILYTGFVFIQSLYEINQRVYTDAQTGLFNKNHWSKLTHHAPGTDPIAVIMLDLNRLKHTNDTMGHEAGDKMIQSFASILRSTIPSSNVICRWGGDEFTVLMPHATREGIERILDSIRDEVEKYNQADGCPPLSYAAGYALSSDYPELSREELLQRADQYMYRNKKKWYVDHTDTLPE